MSTHRLEPGVQESILSAHPDTKTIYFNKGLWEHIHLTLSAYFAVHAFIAGLLIQRLSTPLDRTGGLDWWTYTDCGKTIQFFIIKLERGVES